MSNVPSEYADRSGDEPSLRRIEALVARLSDQDLGRCPLAFPRAAPLPSTPALDGSCTRRHQSMLCFDSARCASASASAGQRGRSSNTKRLNDIELQIGQ